MGGVGSYAAAELAARGHTVLGLDRFTPPHGLGSSGGETRLLRQIPYEGTEYEPLLSAARTAWEDLARGAPEPFSRRASALVIGHPDREPVRTLAKRLSARPEACRVLTSEEIRERFPPFRPSRDEIGLLESDGLVLSPDRCISGALDRARRRGATLWLDEPLVRWRSGSTDVRIETAHREVSARRLVLAVGGWTPGLLPELELPLSVERVVQHWFDPPAGDRARFASPDFPAWVWEHEPGKSWFGFPSTERGVKVGLHRDTGRDTRAERLERRVRADETAGAQATLDRYMRGRFTPRSEASVCMYTTTPDERPILDRHPEHPRVAYFAGGSGHCFKFAPALGALLARIAEGVAPELDPAPYRADRFASRSAAAAGLRASPPGPRST
ncbi:MAG: N-methyl-L-tryptophan oxidase [Gemmatimonadetes bacterium]|nr:N-methyl-L-tryptophan oxidase [Gemmatimonadota bacterium]